MAGTGIVSVALPAAAPTRRLLARQQFDPGDSDEPLPDSDEGWDVWYNRFLAWPADAEGKRLIPTTYETADGHKLGLWQENQRQAYRKELLAPARVQKLEAAGMVWDALEAAWAEAFLKFKAVPLDEKGLRHVPQDYVRLTGSPTPQRCQNPPLLNRSPNAHVASAVASECARRRAVAPRAFPAVPASLPQQDLGESDS